MICFRCFIADHMIMSHPVCSVGRCISDWCILWTRMWDIFFFFSFFSFFFRSNRYQSWQFIIFFLMYLFIFAQLWCRWDASSCVPFYFIFVNGDNKFFYEAFCGPHCFCVRLVSKQNMSIVLFIPLLPYLPLLKFLVRLQQHKSN